MNGKWKVDVKGKPNSTFEISVIRSDNMHGEKSYGWMGKDKVYISGSGGPCSDKVSEMVWHRLIAVAHDVCDELNAGEK